MTNEASRLYNKVLVTGADGFIGSHLVEWLLSQGYSVRALCIYNSNGSWGWLDKQSQDYSDRLEVVLGDVRDPGFLLNITRDIDAILHLAALISIPYSYNAPKSYIETNIIGTGNILEAALRNDIRKTLVTSTSEVYGTAVRVPIDELHPRQPQSPYSASKIAADCLAESYYRTYDLPITIVRPFNTYGPRQSARAFIPSVISQVLTRKTLKVGDLTPKRDLVYVQDTCRGFEKILNCNSLVGTDCNISTGVDYSMQEVLDTILEVTNSSVSVEEDPERIRPAKSEVMRLQGDNSKLYQHLNWKPETTLLDGIRNTADWVENNMANFKPDLYQT